MQGELCALSQTETLPATWHTEGMVRSVVLIVFLLLANACQSGHASARASDESLTVDRVEVEVVRTPAQPPAVIVWVHGHLLDGCTSIGPVIQRREGRVVAVMIATKHSGARFCTQIATVMQQRIRLDGDFASGDYSVNVNGVVRRFSV